MLIGAETMSAARSLVDPVVARAGGEQVVERAQQRSRSSSESMTTPRSPKPGLLQRLVEAERGHRRLPVRGAVQLEHQRLAVAVVEAGAEPRPLRRAGDARLAGDRIAVAPHRRRERPAHQPDLAAEQRAIDLLADAGCARMGQRGERAAEGEDGAGLVGDRDNAGLQRLPGVE